MGEHLFQLAVWSGDTITVQFLLQRLKIDPNAQIQNRYSFWVTPLMFACDQKNLDLVNVLLDAKADVAAADTLSWAFSSRRTILEEGEAQDPDANILRSLIKAGAEINPQRGEPPLCQAASKSDALAVSILLDAGANSNHELWSPLGSAIYASSNCEIDHVLRVVSLLLEAGADPKKGFCEAVIERDHPRFCDCLETDGSDCLDDDETDCMKFGEYYECAIELAANLSNHKLIKLLSQKSGHYCQHLLKFAVENNQLKLAQDCLDHGVPSPGISGWSMKRMTVKMADLILRCEPSDKSFYIKD
ncbi:hypothetical protein N7540_004731 [Penicillium herquei]|nr:hypothetical protein N7540_004731 [Penicillium herquei]